MRELLHPFVLINITIRTCRNEVYPIEGIVTHYSISILEFLPRRKEASPTKGIATHILVDNRKGLQKVEKKLPRLRELPRYSTGIKKELTAFAVALF